MARSSASIPGSAGWITSPAPRAERQIKKYWKHGYSTLYYQFLANVMHEGLPDYIVPVPTTSAICARWLQAQNLVSDIAYIDASHDEDDVYDDMKGYWKTPAQRRNHVRRRLGHRVVRRDLRGQSICEGEGAEPSDRPADMGASEDAVIQSQLVLNLIGQQLQALKK
jgi:hypothetical protein